MDKIGLVMLAVYQFIHPLYNDTVPQKVGTFGFYVTMALMVLYAVGSILMAIQTGLPTLPPGAVSDAGTGADTSLVQDASTGIVGDSGLTVNDINGLKEVGNE